MEIIKGKLVIELDVEISKDGQDGKHHVAKFSHPDLQGHVYLRSGSMEMLKAQINHLDVNKPLSTDPFSVIVNGVTKLTEGVKELKEMVVKKK
jgi:hypothetical protein